jgi:two-component system, chemotaxis family, protein-glutamate methylesterase/glutaminase
MTIRVLIVDDSYVVRRVLEEGLLRHPDLEVMAAVADPLFAMEKMEVQWPDVILLDIEMPRMDGLTFLKQIMSTRPTPIVICSSLVQAGADTSIQALQAGAFAIVPKPKLGVRDFLENAADDLAGIIRAAASSRIQHLVPTFRATPESPVSTKNGGGDPGRIVAIGSSTGGTQALEMILQALPRTCPGIVVVQHMHPELVNVFAETLNRSLSLNVKVAQTGDRITPGWVYLAPGERHLTVERDESGLKCLVKEGPQVSKHCPSVDVLFRSVAKEAGASATGFVLTGMGEDGARGLKEMRDAKAATYAQDEESCVVFGMSKEAIRLGAVERVVSLGEIPEIIAGCAG